MRRSLLVAALVLANTGCATTSINRILAEPERYARRDVTVKGDVVWSASVLGRGAYQLEDGTGRLWVASKHGVPRRGARVKVTGRVQDAFDLGAIVRDLPEQVRDGLVLLEKSHRAD